MKEGGNPSYDYHGFWIAALTLAMMENRSVISAFFRHTRENGYPKKT
ncbi:MAG: hypothetical protein LBB59_00380 [Campylobacteraceae bacterium]|nr:hypothetical protein [Campylobacteraceae bacterium]